MYTHLAQGPAKGLKLRAGDVLGEDPLEGEEEDGHAHELLALGHLYVYEVGGWGVGGWVFWGVGGGCMDRVRPMLGWWRVVVG